MDPLQEELYYNHRKRKTYWKHIKTSEYDWDFFGDKHGRETSKVRTFYEGNQYIWETNLLPNYVAESHVSLRHCSNFS